MTIKCHPSCLPYNMSTLCLAALFLEAGSGWYQSWPGACWVDLAALAGHRQQQQQEQNRKHSDDGFEHQAQLQVQTDSRSCLAYAANASRCGICSPDMSACPAATVLLVPLSHSWRPPVTCGCKSDTKHSGLSLTSTASTADSCAQQQQSQPPHLGSTAAVWPCAVGWHLS